MSGDFEVEELLKKLTVSEKVDLLAGKASSAHISLLAPTLLHVSIHEGADAHSL